MSYLLCVGSTRTQGGEGVPRNDRRSRTNCESHCFSWIYSCDLSLLPSLQGVPGQTGPTGPAGPPGDTGPMGPPVRQGIGSGEVVNYHCTLFLLCAGAHRSPRPERGRRFTWLSWTKRSSGETRYTSRIFLKGIYFLMYGMFL